jgi:subtilisin family serine protease
MTFNGSSSQSVTFNGNVTLSYSGTSSNLLLEIFDGTSLLTECPETQSGSTITFTCSGSPAFGSLSDTYWLEIVDGSNFVAANAFTCPSNNGPSSSSRSAAVLTQQARHPFHRASHTAESMGRIAVVYNSAALQRSAASFARNEQSAGGTLGRSFDYPSLGKTIHVLSMPSTRTAAAIASLRTQSGVLSVSPLERRTALTSSPYLVSNHYFQGFSSPTAPYYELSAVPGQWDMHAIQLEHAFGYATTNNSLGVATANALGSHGVKIAIVDTGQDTLHPDLQGNVVYQACFITNEQNVQSTSSFSTDPQGHGTDVSGIAAAVTNPSNPPATDLGFAGAGGNSGIMAYRVFPTPDDNCANDNSSDDQCGADTSDIASAIDDAVTNGASIISMSLGGGGCTGGNDTDPVEGTAVENAISHNVIVVAASGNESANTVDAPGCDTGVIAVGATSLDDGTPNGTSGSGGNAHPVGTSGAPSEYVASYSNAGSPGRNYQSSTAWGIVAPGGDPAQSEVTGAADDLHWIENIWTSTPYMSSASDATFEGECSDDYPSSTATTSPVDCRTLIAGTSMATPHVAGVAALVLAVSGGASSPYATPAAMKSLLCSTADDISDTREGCGRVNAYRAVATALNDPHLP